MFKTIALLAHVDAGKTSFAEQILYHTKVIRSIGRVDHQSAFLDHHSIEKERGITVFTEQANFQYENSTYYLLDTPGHIDFSSEMERAINILDYAIVIINGAEGIQSHTETIIDCLKRYDIPTFFFINKVDREGVDINQILTNLERKLKINPIYLNYSLDLNEMPDSIIEQLAQLNDELLQLFLEEPVSNDFWLTQFTQAINDQRIYPVMSGSALKDIGIAEFLKKFHLLTPTAYNNEMPVEAFVYKIRYDEKGERLTYLKLLHGALAVKDLIMTSNNLEKVNQIRIYQGQKFEVIPSCAAGQLVAVTGLADTKAGQIIGERVVENEFLLQPVLNVSVEYASSLNPKDVLASFRKLEDEDPMLRVIWNEAAQTIEISVMGSIQLEVLKQVIWDRFQLNVEFGPKKVIYKETILNSVIGSGHYEPLKHYAEVHLRLEPMERGSGISFESVCVAEELELSDQNLIRTHVFEKEHVGVLTGSELTDVKITLLTGRAHQKHTSGGDFREATYRAIRQGLEQTETCLLEPYYAVEIEVDLALMGRVLTDLKKMFGHYDTPVMNELTCQITGQVPVATFLDYQNEFLSYTKGQGKLHVAVAGYERCHNEQEVIQAIGYDKDGDRLNPSSSVFCSKGSGFVVPWNEIEAYMHCKIR